MYMSSSDISVGGKACKVGDVISDAAEIKWGDEKQAMKVMDLENKTIKVLTPAVMKGCKTIQSYYVKNNRLSTRGSMLELEELGPFLSDTHELRNALTIETLAYTGPDAYFSILGFGDDPNKEVRLESESEGNLTLNKADFEQMTPIFDNVYRISVFYVDEDGKSLLTNECYIEIVF